MIAIYIPIDWETQKNWNEQNQRKIHPGTYTLSTSTRKRLKKDKLHHHIQNLQ
jgi:hypothetical protein